MSERLNMVNFSDEELTAFLDDALEADDFTRVEAALEVSPELQDRLALLDISSLPITEAFDSLLEAAPKSRMFSDYQKIIGDQKSKPQHIKPVSIRRGFFWPGAMGLIAASIFAGFLLTPQINQWTAKPGSGWRQAVAEYQSLYTKETLNLNSIPDSLKIQGLAAAGDKIGLELSSDLISAEGLDFKRAQVLSLKGKPVIQLAYLLDQATPVAFCITKSKGGENPAVFESRKGMSIVHWSKDGFNFMIIGDITREKAEALAFSLEQNFT